MPRQVPALPIVQTGNPEVDRLQTFLRQTVERLRAPQDKWSAPTLLNGWVNYGSGNQPAGYMKDGSGFVHLRGLIKSGTLTAAAFNLPTGYRPANDINFGTASNSAFGYGFVRGVTNGGNVGDVVPSAGSNAWFSLDGITFDTR